MTSRARRRRATSPKGGRMGVIVRWTDDEECPSHVWSVLLSRVRAREGLSLLGLSLRMGTPPGPPAYPQPSVG